MNAVTRTEGTALAAMPEEEAIRVLQSSLYPGASPDSIRMVMGYCRASGLDPFQKPVHIVPMWDSKAKSMRDVVMPGIGLYRTQAARSGCAGVTEPEFGPDVTETIGGQSITYPAWCRVTVKRRQPGGEIDEFTAKEFWRENYAIRGGQEKSIAPNAMWTKRPYGQLAKCAEAQALRKAFPEIGSEPTADEMMGKALNEFAEDARNIVKDMGRAEEVQPQALPPYPTDKFETNLPAWLGAIKDGKATADKIVGKLKSTNAITKEQEQSIRSPKSPDQADGAPWDDQQHAQQGEQQ